MTIIKHAINSDYENNVYDYIKYEELLVRRVYSDQRGIPTLGVGYALFETIRPGSDTFRAKLSLVDDLAEIGITLTDADLRLLDRLLNNINIGQGATNLQSVSNVDIQHLDGREEPADTSIALNQFSFGILSNQQIRGLKRGQTRFFIFSQGLKRGQTRFFIFSPFMQNQEIESDPLFFTLVEIPACFGAKQ